MKLKDKSFNISFILGLSFTSLGLGLTLLGWADLGMAFFFFLPLAVGISSGLLPDLKEAIIGTISSLFIFSLFLVVTKAEGIICVIMALPIILLAMLIGWLIGRAIKSKKGEVHLKSTIAPILLFLIVNILEIFSGTPSVPSST